PGATHPRPRAGVLSASTRTRFVAGIVDPTTGCEIRRLTVRLPEAGAMRRARSRCRRAPSTRSIRPSPPQGDAGTRPPRHAAPPLPCRVRCAAARPCPLGALHLATTLAIMGVWLVSLHLDRWLCATAAWYDRTA